ncbi:MAG: glycosyltransferase family 1 protein [Ilumatobacteraceae bacterium]
MAEVRYLVDARSVTHPTAGGRGIGNYTAGLIGGLTAGGADVVALVDPSVPRHPAIAGLRKDVDVLPWRRDLFANAATAGARYVATGLFLPPISFDPIPRIVSELALPTIGVIYDVIPLRHPDLYLADEVASRQVRLRSVLARTVDLAVAISRFSAMTAIAELGLDDRRVHVIGAGVAARFRPPARATDVTRGPVVAVTGPDIRKNTDGLLAGWSRVPEPLRVRHGLVVVAGGPPSMLDGWRRRTRELRCADTVTIAGAVDEQRLVDLLQSAALAVQPSLDEGFGLPVIEAAACGAPGICSATSALPEVLDEPSATFDPLDPDDIARSITRALTDPEHRACLTRAAARATRRWTWRATADAFVAAAAHLADPDRPGPPTPRTRLALAGPPSTEELQRALLAVDGVDTVLLVDHSASREPVRSRPDESRWPIGAFGRGVKYHDVDHTVVVVVDRSGRCAWAAVARRGPVHVWLRDATIDAEMLADARSVIVGERELGRRIADAVGPAVPVVVIPEAAGAEWTQADVARALVDWLVAGHRASSGAVTVVGPTDTLA